MSDTLEDIDTSQLDNVGRVKVDTPSTLNILDITEDCTRLVFDRLTLNQLIHLRAVCHAWNDIITDTCEQKSTLQLFFSKVSVREYYIKITRLNVQDDPQFQMTKQHFLSISPKISSSSEAFKRTGDGSFSEQQNDPNLGIRFIARLFPIITNFVCDFQYDRLFELNYILWKWSANLDTLVIFSDYLTFDRIYENALQDLVKCFEQMSSLRRLHLLAECNELDLPNVATFGQLEEFTFDCSSLRFAPYFAQLDANSCKFLRVVNHQDCWETSSNPLDTNPELVSKLTHLSICYSLQAHPNHISHHCAKFENLTHLEIVDNYYHSLAHVLQQIVPLQKLKTLALNLRNLSIDQEYYSTLNPNYFINYRNTFPVFHNTITELRLLDNRVNYKGADKSYFPVIQEYQLLARIFPIVREIRIYSSKLNKATFDAQFRPRFSEAFGERVEIEFIQNAKNTITVEDWSSIKGLHFNILTD